MKNNSLTTKKIMRWTARFILLVATLVAVFLPIYKIGKIAIRLFFSGNQGLHLFIGFFLIMFVGMTLFLNAEKFYNQLPKIIHQEEREIVSIIRLAFRLISIILFWLSGMFYKADKYLKPKKHFRKVKSSRNITDITRYRQKQYKRKNRRVG